MSNNVKELIYKNSCKTFKNIIKFQKKIQNYYKKCLW